MKKLVIVLMTLALCMSMVACSSEGGKTNVSSGDKKNQGEVEQTWGKIDSIAGNSMKVSLAKEPSEEERLSGGAGVMIVDENDPNVGETNVTVTTDESGKEIVEGVQEPKIELEYTGEKKEITIPAGATIFNLQTGTETKMDELKKGTVIQIISEKSTGTITEVYILE